MLNPSVCSKRISIKHSSFFKFFKLFSEMFYVEAVPEITMVHKISIFAVAVAPESTQEGKFTRSGIV